MPYERVCVERLEIVVELLRLRVKPLENGHHAIVPVACARVGLHFAVEPDEGADRIRETRELSVRGGREDSAAPAAPPRADPSRATPPRPPR